MAAQSGIPSLRLARDSHSACGAERTAAAVFGALRILPAVLAYERHKTHRSDLAFLQNVTTPCEHEQRLLFAIAERNENSSALGQLLVIRRRNFGRSGSHQNSIIGSVLPPSQRAVAKKKGNISRADLPDDLARAIEERGNALDGEHL